MPPTAATCTAAAVGSCDLNANYRAVVQAPSMKYSRCTVTPGERMLASWSQELTRAHTLLVLGGGDSWEMSTTRRSVLECFMSLFMITLCRWVLKLSGGKR